MYIERNITEYLKNTVKSSLVTLVTGSRQVGKSTLIRHSFPEYNYVTFDNIEALELARNDVKAFFKKYKYPLIIDEFQYAPNILSEIKLIVDEIKYENLNNKKTKVSKNNLTKKNKSYGYFILTGSQRFESMKNIKESLAGRVSIINLYGLTNREIKKDKVKAFLPDKIDGNYKYKNSKNIFEKIYKGSFPEIQDISDDMIDNFFENYINTYIERDVKNIINISDKIKFIKFVRNLAARTSQELNMTDICNGIDITIATGNKWLSLLEDTNLIYLLPPYFNNAINRIIKRPKIHFMDTGLASYLAGYHSIEAIERSAYAGSIFETYVVSEIIKSHVNAGLNIKDKFYYIRNSNNVEIDLIMNINNTFYPIEIKKSHTPDKSCIKNFSLLHKSKVKTGNGIVICDRNDCMPIDSENMMIPVEII